MFPNPQDALPLPLRPNLEHYRKLAKDLSKACRSGPDALHESVRRWIERLVKSSGIEFGLRLPVGLDLWIKDVNEFADLTLREQSCTVTAAPVCHRALARLRELAEVRASHGRTGSRNFAGGPI